MSEHTPGPWQIVENSGTVRRPCTIVGNSGAIVCETYWDALLEEHDNECGANARLIAAAPELLEVVRELAETPWGEIHIKQLQGRAIEANAKAKGGKVDIAAGLKKVKEEVGKWPTWMKSK